MAWPALAAPKSRNCRALCLPASWCHTYSWSWTWGAAAGPTSSPAGNCKPPVPAHTARGFSAHPKTRPSYQITNFTPSYNLPLYHERYYKTPFLSHSSSIINSFLPLLVYYYSIILQFHIPIIHTPNMAILYFLPILLILSLSFTGARQLPESPMLFQYHKGPLLTGKLSVNLVWYGNFKPAQRAILSDFVASLSSTSPKSPQPSVATWWKSTHKLYSSLATSKSGGAFSVGKQIMDPRYSLGKSLTSQHIRRLARRAGLDTPNSVNVVFTADDVAVDGFCRSSCGSHGVLQKRVPYIWVGNSETQCPGQCAWPFHKPIYGPQSPALVAPNNDVGVDGMVINLATLLAGTVTNPFGNGYYQGPKEAPLEAASACPGVYGKGAYPGYPGNLLVDPTTGASYNANGVNGRKYLLPALYDPATSSCSTLL